MVVYSLYDGQVALKYDPIAHLYRANGVPVPSVTKITGVIDKPALMYWAVNQTVEFLEGVWNPGQAYTEDQIKTLLDDAKGARYRTQQRALSIGSQAHDWIERHIKAQIFDLPMPEMPEDQAVVHAIKAFIDWEKEASPKYLYSERKLLSKKYMYSGTVDILMEIGDRYIVADLKTSKDIYEEYFLQCAAYAQAVEEEDGIEVSELMIIRVPKEDSEYTGGSGVQIAIESDVQKLFNVFKACLILWRWKNNWEPTGK